MSPSHPLAPIAVAATVSLVLAGCTTDDGDGVAAPDPEASRSDTAPSNAPSPSEAATAPSPSPSEAPRAAELPALDEQCTIAPEQTAVDQIRYAVPASWKVEDRCDVLDPDLEDLPDQTEVAAAIFVSTSGVSYREAAAPGGGSEVQRVWLGARAGYQASRSTAVSTGEALTPEGRPSTNYLVDLDAGADEQGGVLTMSTGVGEGEGFELASATLDAIADTVVIDPPAVDAETDGFAVLRAEGGGTPFSVTFDGDCFRLRPGAPDQEATDELCDLDPRDGDIVSGLLAEDVVVGYAPPLAIGVEGGPDTVTNALTASIEGGTVFALRSVDVPEQVTAIGPGGERLASADVGTG